MVARQKKVMILDNKGHCNPQILEAIESAGYFPYVFRDYNRAFGLLLNEPPDLLLLFAFDTDWDQWFRQIRKDPAYGHLPILLILPRGSRWGSATPDDFLYEGFAIDELLLRLEMIQYRSSNYLDANPLTLLPGNYAISKTIQERIDSDEDFALAYLDLDHFKGYNDLYGFARGDEVLRMTARIIVNVVRHIAGDHGFVGHIGGDDFVFIVHSDKVEAACAQILSHFDLLVPAFYDENDRAKGRIDTIDRQGNSITYPILTGSIAVVMPQRRGMTHAGQAAAVAGEIKKVVKKKDGSNFLIDRRNTLYGQVNLPREEPTRPVAAKC